MCNLSHSARVQRRLHAWIVDASGELDSGWVISHAISNGYGVTNSQYLTVIFGGFEIWGALLALRSQRSVRRSTSHKGAGATRTCRPARLHR